MAQLKEQAAQIQNVSAQLEARNLRRRWSRTTTKGVGFVKYWEIIADNLSKAGWSRGFRVVG